MKKITIFILLALLVTGIIYQDVLVRLYQGFRLNQVSKERAKYYVLKNGIQIQDITQQLISDLSIPKELKAPLIKGERRIVIFKYLSDTNQVAGYMSYLSQGEHPTLIVLRGGNNYLGIMRPNNQFSYLDGYNVIGTLYRGNIYGGKDEFGGKDIQDVENLMRFFPQLTLFTHKKINPPFIMIGISRGAMEMFIALSQLNYVKSRISHAISISGNLDLQTSMQNRPEMKYLFMNEFKQSNEKNFSDWLKKRDPIDQVKNLSNKMKILLVYGLNDNRVSLQEQQNFKQALDKAGLKAQLVTIPGANHGIDDHFDELETIIAAFIKSK